MIQDKNFDALAEKFARKIYSNTKGEVRLAILWHHLNHCLPAIEGAKPLQILDIGGGMGQMALRLVQQGHNVTLCDPSENMLAFAREAKELLPEEAQNRLCIFNCSLQTALDEWQGQFDLVLCHAVLEWLAEPLAAIAVLRSFLKAKGYLSLMFYNKHSIVIRNLIRGNFKKVKSGDLAGYKNSLTPMNPLEPSQVYGEVEGNRLRIVGKAGVRVFSDYLTKEIIENRSYEDTLELEMEYCDQEPYVSIARYIHVLCMNDLGDDSVV